ncbi:MAG: hypothetical protein JWP08_133, partial [Bryobacterales bacterium]|nr:hypothetical protein [Bryobacterales bacterium]
MIGSSSTPKMRNFFFTGIVRLALIHHGAEQGVDLVFEKLPQRGVKERPGFQS